MIGTRREKMSSPEMETYPPRAAVAPAARQAGRLRQGSFVLALLATLGVSACTGGAGLDVPIGPVDHSCPVENSCGHR
jgi:hypothetical protein